MSDRIIHVLAGDIVKANRRDDGTVEFLTSKAAGPELDIDSQILDPKWLGKEMPEWFETGGNLREMHQPIAAGVATSIEERPDGYYIAGDVVDPGSATKVEKGILRQLSVGIKGARIVKDAAAPGGRVVGGKIVEVSLVDRAANSTCKLVLAKAATPDAAIEHVEELTEPDVTKAARGHSHPHAHEDGSHAHAHTHDPGGSYDHGDGEPHGHAHASTNPPRIDGGMAHKSAEADLSASEEDDMPLTIAALTDLLKGATADERSALAGFLLAERLTTESGDKPAEVTGLLNKPVTKAAESDEKDKTTDAPAALDPEKFKSDIIDATKAAVAEATKGLVDQLAEVKKMAAPGGPVRMASATNKGAEPDDKATQRAYYLRQAALVDDPVMVAGYRAKADALR